MARAGDSGKELLKQAFSGGLEASAPPPAIGYATAVPLEGSAPGWGGSGGLTPAKSSMAAGVATATVVSATATATATAVSVATARPQSVPVAAPQFGVAQTTATAYARASGPPAGAGGSYIGPGFFQEYAQTVDGIQSLERVESDIAQTLAAIESTRGKINNLERKLAKARKDQPELEKRLHRNANPRFLHYMQIHRGQKVERLSKQLDNVKARQEEWTGEKHAAEETLRQKERMLSELQARKAQKDELCSRRQAMYEQAVASVPPTPRLQQIESNLASQSAALQNEQGLLSQVDSVIVTLRQAQGLYQRSQQMLQRAMSSNQTAQVVNFLDAGDRGPDFFERANQLQRDRLINESQQPAMEAYGVIERAWAMFPHEARERYPSLAAQIGNTPMPRLRSANFGNTLATGFVFGNIGDAINNGYAGGKIRENMQIIAQSNQIVEQQLQLVLALRQAIAANVAQMEGQFNTLQSQKQEERDSIFEGVRAQALGVYGGGGPTQAQAFAF